MGRSNSVVSIYNRALMAIGENVMLESGEETTPAGEACRLHYLDCLEKCLKRYPWQWATKEAAISAPSGVSRNAWDYVYTLPSDCVRPIALLADGSRVSLLGLEDNAHFEIRLGDDDKSLLLCCDLEVSEDFEVLEYVALVEYVPIMPRQFVEAVSLFLASKIAGPLKKKPAEAASFRQMADHTLEEAWCDELNSRVEDPAPTTPSISKRA